MNLPKILTLDIETAPMLGYVWSLWENNVALNQLKKDWYVLSFAAKWMDSDNVIYFDQRDEKNIENDKNLLKKIWKLLDKADIIVTQNGKSFDIKKLNARFILNGLPPPSPFRHIDTKVIASRKFAFTSNKLEYLSKNLNKKYKKLTHHKFGGFRLWTECLAGNLKAWKEMEKYNKYDVLSTEELYLVLQPWDNSLRLDLYAEDTICNCGSTSFIKYGYHYTNSGKFQRFKCTKCGATHRDNENLLTKAKKRTLRRPL